MGITKYLDDIQQDFEIYGELKDGWDDFKKDIEYSAFFVKRIILNGNKIYQYSPLQNCTSTL